MEKKFLKMIIRIVGVAIFIGIVGGTWVVVQAGAPVVVEFNLANIEYEGSKMFVPSVVVVNKGDTVKLKILNKIASEPPVHGFAIDEYNIKVEILKGETKEVQFTADKEGVIKFYCHLHPAHIAGQVLVLGK